MRIEYGLLAATILQTFFAFTFLFLLIPWRYSFKRSLLMVISAIIFCCVLSGGLVTLFGKFFLMRYGVLTVGLPYFIMLYFLSKAKGVCFLFIVLTSLIYHYMLAVLLIVIRVYVGFSPVYFFLNFVLYFGLLYVIYRIRKGFHKIVFIYKYEFIWLLAVLVLLLIMMIAFIPVTTQDTIDPYKFTLSLIVFTLTVMIYLYIGVSFRNLSKRYDAERNALFLRHQMEEAKNQIALLRVSQEKAALYRHDLRHHLQYLNICMDEGKLEEAKHYISLVCDKIIEASVQRYCENETVNLLLSGFATKAEEYGVSMDIHVVMPKITKIPADVLCVIFANALENAIHACKGLRKDREKKFFVSCKSKHEKLYIRIENPFSHEIVFVDGVPQSKEQGHGIGVKSIIQTVEAHDGLCSFEVQDDRFVVNVIL